VAGLLLAWCPCAFALDPALDVSQYAHTSWKIRDGFTKGEINSIAQTPDGYLWLGTEFGLLRFDGVSVVPWQPPKGQGIPNSYITTLLAARDGALWIGTLKGLASLKDGKLTVYPDLETQAVYALLEDDEGTIWAGGSAIPVGRLCAIRSEGVQCFGADKSLGRWVTSLFEDSRKNVWAATEIGLWRWKPGPRKLYAIPAAIVERQSLIEDDGGALLISTESGIRRLVNGELGSYPISTVGRQLKTRGLFWDRDGGLWIGTSRGLVHMHQGRTDVFSPSDGLSGDHIQALFEDREGDIWVATNGGLDRFRDFAVVTFSVGQGLFQASVVSVLADRDGSIWLTDGYVQRLNKGQVSTHGKRDGNLSGQKLSLFQDRHGRIWVSTLGGFGYLEKDRFISIPGIAGGPVRGIAEDNVGSLWIANLNAGLLQLSARNEVQQVPWDKLGHKDFATALAIDPSGGGLWLGFYDGGIAYFRDGQLDASYGTADGLGEGAVSRFHFDPDDTVWVATQGGLSRLKNGRVATLTKENGLPCDAVNWVIQDNDHSFWLDMPCGLVRILRTEVDAWASAVDRDIDVKQTITTTVFDSSDGVRSRGFPGGASSRVTRSSDGKLWFATNDGVSVVDPRHIAFNKLPPPVHIERITADRKTYDADSIADGHSPFPPLVRDLEIEYTALSLAAPEKVLFRYKLEPRDRDWQSSGTRRRAFYTDLPPGKYRFRVMACNNSGVWNEAGTFLDFSIAPAYYQTTLFRLSCIAGFLLLLAVLYQLRLRQVSRKFNVRMEERVGERTRIARDFHDTLLQSFQGVLLKFQALTYLPDLSNETRQKLEGAIDQAEQAIIEGRDAVQGLRSSTVVTNDLAQAISAFGEELAAGESDRHSPDFRLTVEGTSKDLAPLVRDEVYRIACEALQNAFRHAQAGRIEVEIMYERRQLRLRVRDDGKGIDQKLVDGGGRSGHYGLGGMRERAELVGGDLEIWSERHSGTEIELTIPGSVAYAKAPATRKLVFFGKRT